MTKIAGLTPASRQVNLIGKITAKPPERSVSSRFGDVENRICEATIGDETGTITLFDFDDCNYSWFVNDIAIVLFYMVVMKEDTPAFTREFMPHFLRGYIQENHLNPKWLKEIPYFLKLREIDLYAIIHRSFDINNLDNPWCSRYMENRKERIEQELPYIDLDFESLARWL